MFNALIVKEAGEELKIALKNRNFSFDCSDQSDALIRRMLEAFASNLNIPDLRVCNSERLGSEYSVLIDSVNGKFQLEFYYSQTLDTDGQVIGTTLKYSINRLY